MSLHYSTESDLHTKAAVNWTGLTSDEDLYFFVRLPKSKMQRKAPDLSINQKKWKMEMQYIDDVDVVV